MTVATNAIAKGGTVYSCVLLAEYPNPATMLGVKYARPKRLTPLQKSVRTRIHRQRSGSAPKMSFRMILVLSLPFASSSRRCWQYSRSD
jgi:hypothetical protein